MEMAKECRAGAIRPNAERIKELRTKKGWGQGDFADAAGVGKRTVEKLETGACCYLITLKLLAKALGVAVEALMLTKTAPLPGKTVEVQITLKVPYGEFDQSEQLVGIVSTIMALVRGGAIDVVKVGSGSTIITLAMSPEMAVELTEMMEYLWSEPSEGGGIGGVVRLKHGAEIKAMLDGSAGRSEEGSYFALIQSIALPDDGALPDAFKGKHLNLNV